MSHILENTLNLIYSGNTLQFGLGLALILLFGNKMLLTSWLSSSLLASIWIVYGKEIMENTIKIVRKEEPKEEKQEEMKEKPKEVKKEMKKEDQKPEEQQAQV